MKKVQIPTGDPVGRIICQECGNDTDFIEQADNVTVTTHFIQNTDGSFTPAENTTEIIGEVRFLCGFCGADLSQFHTHFQEMSF